MPNPTTSPADVRLDEKTDAGEFLVQNLYHLSGNMATAAFNVMVQPEPTPQALSEVLGDDLQNYDLVMTGLGQYGMEFESMGERGDFDYVSAQLAERGVSSAEAFVRAARKLAQERSNA